MMVLKVFVLVNTSLSFLCFNLDSTNEATATETTNKKKKTGKITHFFILIYCFYIIFYINVYIKCIGTLLM